MVDRRCCGKLVRREPAPVVGGCDPAGGRVTAQADVPATVEFPPPVSYTDADTISVRGTAFAAVGVGGLTVDGVAATSTDGFATWSAEIPVRDRTNETATWHPAEDVAAMQPYLPSVRVFLLSAGPCLTCESGCSSVEAALRSEELNNLVRLTWRGPDWQ